MLPTPPPGPADPFADFDQYVASLQKQETAPPPGPAPPQTAPPSSDPFSDFDQFIQPLLQERQIEQSTGMPATPISPLLNRPMIPGVAEGVEGSLRYGEGTRSQPTFGEQAASVFQAIPSGAQRQLGGLGEYLQALASAGETPGLRLPIPAEVVSAPLRAIGETLESGQEAYFRNNQEQEIRNQQIAEQHPVTGFLQDVAGQVPQLAMALGAGGGAPALAALGASAAGQEMQRAESMGADPGQTLAAGTMSGAIEAATEMFGKVGLASEAFRVAEAGTPVGQSALKAILGDVAENFGQEVAASVGQRFTQLAVYEDGTYGWQDVKSALYDGLVGAVVGGGMSAATQGLGRLRGQLPSEAAPRAYADERQLGAEVLAAARARAQEDAAARQAQDAALGEAPPAAGEIVVPEVLPLPPLPQEAPPAPQEAAPAPIPPVVEESAAPPVQTFVEAPAPPPVEVVTEPAPPPPMAQPVVEEAVPTQVAPQEAQNVQQAAQADVAERPAPAPDEAQPAQARGAAQAAVADREPGVVLADFGGRFASTIYKNPTQRDIQDIRKWNRTEHRDRNSMAEPQFRSLIDADGNSYAWSSFEGTHEQARAILEERGVRFQGDGQARAGSNLKDIRLQEDAVAPQPTPQEAPDALRRQEGREAVEPGVPAPPVPSPAPEVAIPAEPEAGRGTTEALAAPLPAATPAPTAPKTPADLEAMAMPIPAPVAEATTAAREQVGEARQAENDRIREEADEAISKLEEKIRNAEARRTPGNSEQTDKRIARYQEKIEKIEREAEAAIKAPIEAEIPAKERPAGAEQIDPTRPPAEPRSSVEDALNARRDEVFGPIRPTTMEDKVPTVQIGTQTRPGGTQQTAHRMTRLPELVRLAKRLMAEGVEIRNIPKKMREGLLGAVSFKGRTLMLNPKIAATPGLAEAVIAHEVGHLADMFPNRVSPIFDRILKIKQALQQLGNNAAVKRRKGLIERQAREVAREWAKRSPIQMPAKVLDSKYFGTPSEVYANVTGAILNDPELVRQLAPDLYVDFMGRLDADPRLSEAWRETQEDVARPEEEKLADTLEQQREEEARGTEARLQGIRNRLKPEALTKLQKRLTGFVSRGLANYWDKRSPSYRLGRYVAAELRKAGNANEADALMERMEKMQWAAEDSDHFFSRISAYYDLFKEHILAPLEAKGLTSSDFSLALRLLDQEANPDLFGSQGLRGDEASRVLNHLMKDLGQEKADALVEATQDYWVLRSTILARFAEAGTETQEGIEKILENAAYARRTGLSFLEAEATESTKAGGGPTNIEGALYSALKHREGSLQATGSALVETLLVDAAIMRASERALAKKYTVQFLRSVDGGKGEVIKSARMVGEGVFEKPPVGWELIKTREGGRTVGYFVPEAVYRGIEKAPGDTASTMKLLDYANRILRPLLVTHNPAWALFNVQRDFWAAYKNHTNPDPLGAFLETVRFASGAGAELGRLYLRARGEASERTEGWTGHLPKVLRGWVSGLTAWEQMRTPIEQEMALQAATLTMPENRNSLMAAAANLDPTKMDELQQFRAIFDLQLRKTLGDPFASVLDPNSNRFTKAMDFIEQHAKPFAALGMASERGIKIAGYRMLTARKAKLEAKRAAGAISKRQSAELERLSKPGYIPRVVRARMGSPDFLRRGLEYNRYNRWLLFSNAAKEGLRSSIEAAKDDPAGYAIKTMMVNVVPKMVTAWLVANDDDFREWYRGIPQWLRMSFTPIPMPLALGPKGESRYIPLPQDFTGAFINGLMDVLVIQGLIEDRPVTPKKILTALNPLFVYSLGSLNPAVETAYQAFSLASGSNPDDFFRGRDMFDPFAFRNMSDAQKWQTFAKETWNNMGFSLIYRPPSSWEDAGKEEQAWWQKAIDRFPVWANMSRRLRGSTDAGRREEAYEVLGPVRGRKAEERAARDEYATELLKTDPDRSDREIAEDVYRHLIDLGYTDATEAKHIIATIRALRDRLKWGTKSPEEKILDIAKTKAEEKVLRERFGIPEDEEEE